jgi:hypothetical protein
MDQQTLVQPEDQAIPTTSNQPVVKASFDPSRIYPTATDAATKPTTANSSDQLNTMRANAGLQMAGVKHLAHSSKKVDAIGALIIVGGLIQAAVSIEHLNIGIAFDIVYIVVGAGIIMRSELARKIVVYVGGFSVLMSIIGLIGILSSDDGVRLLLSVASLIFSVVVLIFVLSILTDPNVESEFS